MNNLHLADVVKSSQGNYRIIVGHNIVDSLPKELNLCTNNKKIFLIADKALFPKQVLELSELLEKNGFEISISLRRKKTDLFSPFPDRYFLRTQSEE